MKRADHGRIYNGSSKEFNFQIIELEPYKIKFVMGDKFKITIRKDREEDDEPRVQWINKTFTRGLFGSSSGPTQIHAKP